MPAVDRPKFITSISTVYDKLKWTLARSFLQNKSGSFTGVATGATVEPVNEIKLISPVAEPFSNTPKTALVSDFKITGRGGNERVLRVINVHAINFVSNESFYAHMKQVFAAIREHDGPLILAGDFNTWNPWRTKFLKLVTTTPKENSDDAFRDFRFGLKTAHSAPGILLTLDYVFTRGLKTIQAHDLAEIRSSDHQPILLDFEFDEIP